MPYFLFYQVIFRYILFVAFVYHCSPPFLRFIYSFLFLFYTFAFKGMYTLFSRCASLIWSDNVCMHVCVCVITFDDLNAMLKSCVSTRSFHTYMLCSHAHLILVFIGNHFSFLLFISLFFPSPVLFRSFFYFSYRLHWRPPQEQ